MRGLEKADKAAREAGMSYGQYMAQSRMRRDTPRRAVHRSPVIYCKICGTPFPAGGHRKKYCSDACYQAARHDYDRRYRSKHE